MGSVHVDVPALALLVIVVNGVWLERRVRRTERALLALATEVGTPEALVAAKLMLSPRSLRRFEREQALRIRMTPTPTRTANS